jgi:hypothetical protein
MIAVAATAAAMNFLRLDIAPFPPVLLFAIIPSRLLDCQ